MSIISDAVNLGGDKLVMVVGHQFITLAVYICVQHGGCKALDREGLSAAAENCTRNLLHHTTMKIGEHFAQFSQRSSTTLQVSIPLYDSQ